MRELLRAIGGLVALFLIHVPRLVWAALQWSYASAFHNRPNLTADPQEHLRRAKRLLRSRKNSQLLYAALEIRFALERIAHTDLFHDSISNRVRKKYQPTKKLKGLNMAEPGAKVPHRMVLVHRETGERVPWGDFHPLDPARVSEIEGRLGDLLHPKVGLPLGVPDSPWYRETRAFLWEAHDSLASLPEDRKFFLGTEDGEGPWRVEREPLDSVDPGSF